MSLLPKDQLVEMLVNNTLYNFLLKKNLIKKGDTFTYSGLVGITTADLKLYFEKKGYPGLRSSPPGGENDTIWTLEDGVYTALFIERNTDTPVYSTKSKEEFQNWWKTHILEEFEFKLTYPFKVY